MKTLSSYDTIIIGAGMSGLAAGIRLAQFGQEVLVLEKHYLWGGLNSYYKLGGRRFDSGLHALTNYAEAKQRRRPLNRILRQLGLSHADLRLAEQSYSEIAFPDLRLKASNDIRLLVSEVETHFPQQRDAFQQLLRRIGEYTFSDPDSPASELAAASARSILNEILEDPLLIEMLLLPICLYGSPRENDIDWELFVVLFRSIFEEGLARPEGGVRRILDLLVQRFKDLGGELRMQSGVRRILLAKDGLAQGTQAVGVELEGGQELRADRIFSSAGFVETLRLCGLEHEHSTPADVGVMTFVESISVLERMPAESGLTATIVFFNDDQELLYRRPQADIEARIGLVCCPNNYASESPLPEGLLRLTSPANYERWVGLEEADYVQRKERAYQEAFDVAARYVPDLREQVVFKDIFTPRTIEKFTGHLNGAVYGSARKLRSGRTPIDSLYLCGADQGNLGVVGALHSGVLMATQHVLIAH